MPPVDIYIKPLPGTHQPPHVHSDVLAAEARDALLVPVTLHGLTHPGPLLAAETRTSPPNGRRYRPEPLAPLRLDFIGVDEPRCRSGKMWLLYPATCRRIELRFAPMSPAGTVAIVKCIDASTGQQPSAAVYVLCIPQSAGRLTGVSAGPAAETVAWYRVGRDMQGKGFLYLVAVAAAVPEAEPWGFLDVSTANGSIVI